MSLPAALFAAALGLSLFFNGEGIGYFSATLGLLIILSILVLLRGYRQGFHFPKTYLAFFLTLFWIWLGLSSFWSKAPSVSTITFWWIGSLPLVFWIYTLAPDADRFGRQGTRWVLAIAVGLALLAAYQLLALQAEPRATFLTRNSLAAFINIVALPASAYFLLTGYERPGAKRILWILGTSLFVLFFTLALIRGRGAMISAALALGILISVSYTRVPKKYLALLLLIATSAFLLANLLWQGGVIERMASVFNPAVAGSDRFLIWRGAWEMLKEAPWFGIGLGTFWLAWPPYRHPQDMSGGYYVHNDYLQLWIEAGLPGLILLFAVLLSVGWLFVRMVRAPETAAPTKVEAAGLFGGLLAVAVHSIVDFNFYILPILLLAGLVLGRLHRLYTALVGSDFMVLHPSPTFGVKSYRYLVGFFTGLLLLYFSALAAANYSVQQAGGLVAQGQWLKADAALRRAELLMPSLDIPTLVHAEFSMQALALVPEAETKSRQALFDQALDSLNATERANPLRPQIYFLRGKLLFQYPEFAGTDALPQAVRAYRTALQRNPRFHPARTAYALLLRQQGDTQQARQLLEEGMSYWYHQDLGVIPYYALTASLRQETGDVAAARALEKIVGEIQQTAGLQAQPIRATTP